ncbi:MAG: outer membrane protein assembly factor [Gammaproteobacteria bacterium]|nr:outer membrane protein assembly factor [Gammaproteobacteria bacterium]
MTRFGTLGWKLAIFVLTVAAGRASAGVDIDIRDSDAPLEANVRAHLRLLKEDCDSPQWRVRRFHTRVEKDVARALRAFGYYRPTVDSRLQFKDDDCWQATITIDPGERTRVRNREIVIVGDAQSDPAFTSLLGTLPLSPGEPLDHAAYESVKSQLRALAGRRGYLDFAFERQELRVHPDDAVADIVLHANSGERYRIGEVRFGPHPLSDDLVRRLARLSPGDEFDSGSLIDLDRHLSNSGYFRGVEVRPDRAGAHDGEVPVDVLLEPASRHAWRAGVGYSTDTLWRLSLGYDNRYVNPEGHRFESEVRVGPVEAGAKADYLIPGADPHVDNYSFGARLLHEDNDGRISDSASLIARHVHKGGDWTQTRFVELLHERSEVGGSVSRDTLVMPGIALDRVHSDDVLRPNRGYRVNLEVRGAHDDLLSTVTMLQLRASVKGLYRIPGAGRLIGRGQVGLTFGDEVEDLPVSLRFFAGGDNSVRGYAYKSLGPIDANGDVVGGRQLVTGSIEYEHPVRGDDWWLAAFVDAGNAFDEIDDDVDLKVGYGIGVRWYSPIGRIRLDVGLPEENASDDWRIHFALGTEL